MTKTYIDKREVIYIPGACSTPPGDPFHVLHFSKNGPYRRFCDDTDDFLIRREGGLTAPAHRWCETCLKKYARWSRQDTPIYQLGLNPPGQYIVSAGMGWHKGSVFPNWYDVPSPAEQDALVYGFITTLKAEGVRCGFNLLWQPDYSPLPVLLADIEDYYFDWWALLFRTKEIAAQALLDANREVDEKAAIRAAIMKGAGKGYHSTFG